MISVSPVDLCPRCEEFSSIKPNFRCCDECEFEMLKEIQNAYLQQEESAA